MTVEELSDEISAIEAIFPGSVQSVAPQIYTFSVPQHSALKFQLNFPVEYPDIIPQVLQVLSDDLSKYADPGYFEVHVKQILERIFVQGEVCIFEMMSEMELFLEEYDKEHPPAPPKPAVVRPEKQDKPQESKLKVIEPVSTIDPLQGWHQSQPVVDRGSTFIAFVREVSSVEEAVKYISLLSTDRKIARASHNITSWRIKGQNGVQFQDCDDDGETAAGGRLLHLLTMMDVWNVVVVVSRWFGGTHLGPDRFKHINSVARDAVMSSGLGQKK